MVRKLTPFVVALGVDEAGLPLLNYLSAETATIGRVHGDLSKSLSRDAEAILQTFTMREEVMSREKMRSLFLSSPVLQAVEEWACEKGVARPLPVDASWMWAKEEWMAFHYFPLPREIELEGQEVVLRS